MIYEVVYGDLIVLAKEGKFDVITHGCNCFSRMGAGIAPLMAKAFGCDEYPLEDRNKAGDINKLGQIEFGGYVLDIEERINPFKANQFLKTQNTPTKNFLYVVNSYSQYAPGIPNDIYGIPLDYDALRLTMRKINQAFKGKHLGLPLIGGGLAGGNREDIEIILKTELKDLSKVTLVLLP